MMKPLNDNLKVELPKNDFIVSNEDDDLSNPMAGVGTVVAIPDIEDIMYFGSYNWAFDGSLFDQKIAHQVHAKMTALLNHEILFERRADSGLTFEEDGKTYCMLKLAKVIGYNTERND